MIKISNNELSDQAYKEVRAMIMSKKILPGEKIVQDKLAEDLGISRTPLRSALQMLEVEGLIESAPKKGFVVKEFSNKEILELYDCRIALEGMAIRLFTNNASQNEIDKLRTHFDPFLDGDINVSSYQKADTKFHNAIIQGCKNSFLQRIFKQGNLLTCIDLIGLLRPPEETLQEHMDIIYAIERREIDLAESLIKLHLDRTKQIIEKKTNG